MISDNTISVPTNDGETIHYLETPRGVRFGDPVAYVWTRDASDELLPYRAGFDTIEDALEELRRRVVGWGGSVVFNHAGDPVLARDARH